MSNKFWTLRIYVIGNDEPLFIHGFSTFELENFKLWYNAGVEQTREYELDDGFTRCLSSRRINYFDFCEEE